MSDLHAKLCELSTADFEKLAVAAVRLELGPARVTPYRTRHGVNDGGYDGRLDPLPGCPLPAGPEHWAIEAKSTLTASSLTGELRAYFERSRPPPPGLILVNRLRLTHAQHQTLRDLANPTPLHLLDGSTLVELLEQHPWLRATYLRAEDRPHWIDPSPLPTPDDGRLVPSEQQVVRELTEPFEHAEEAGVWGLVTRTPPGRARDVVLHAGSTQVEQGVAPAALTLSGVPDAADLRRYLGASPSDTTLLLPDASLAVPLARGLASTPIPGLRVIATVDDPDIVERALQRIEPPPRIVRAHVRPRSPAEEEGREPTPTQVFDDLMADADLDVLEIAAWVTLLSDPMALVPFPPSVHAHEVAAALQIDTPSARQRLLRAHNHRPYPLVRDTHTPYMCSDLAPVAAEGQPGDGPWAPYNRRTAIGTLGALLDTLHRRGNLERLIGPFVDYVADHPLTLEHARTHLHLVRTDLPPAHLALDAAERLLQRALPEPLRQQWRHPTDDEAFEARLKAIEQDLLHNVHATSQLQGLIPEARHSTRRLRLFLQTLARCRPHMPWRGGSMYREVPSFLHLSASLWRPPKNLHPGDVRDVLEWVLRQWRAHPEDLAWPWIAGQAASVWTGPILEKDLPEGTAPAIIREAILTTIGIAGTLIREGTLRDLGALDELVCRAASRRGLDLETHAQGRLLLAVTEASLDRWDQPADLPTRHTLYRWLLRLAQLKHLPSELRTRAIEALSSLLDPATYLHHLTLGLTSSVDLSAGLEALRSGDLSRAKAALDWRFGQEPDHAIGVQAATTLKPTDVEPTLCALGDALQTLREVGVSTHPRLYALAGWASVQPEGFQQLATSARWRTLPKQTRALLIPLLPQLFPEEITHLAQVDPSHSAQGFRRELFRFLQDPGSFDPEFGHPWLWVVQRATWTSPSLATLHRLANRAPPWLTEDLLKWWYHRTHASSGDLPPIDPRDASAALRALLHRDLTPTFFSYLQGFLNKKDDPGPPVIDEITRPALLTALTKHFSAGAPPDERWHLTTHRPHFLREVVHHDPSTFWNIKWDLKIDPKSSSHELHCTTEVLLTLLDAAPRQPSGHLDGGLEMPGEPATAFGYTRRNLLRAVVRGLDPAALDARLAALSDDDPVLLDLLYHAPLTLDRLPHLVRAIRARLERFEPDHADMAAWNIGKGSREIGPCRIENFRPDHPPELPPDPVYLALKNEGARRGGDLGRALQCAALGRYAGFEIDPAPRPTRPT